MIPEELRAELLEAIIPLESMELDWHPGSKGQVLDLVHPSLYPVVYGRSVCKIDDEGAEEVIEAPEEESYAVSKNFQWLPSDFAISEMGEVTLTSPYINNINQVKHAQLYEVIPRILQRAIPMFERVLSDLQRPLLPWRVETSPRWDYDSYNKVFAPNCIWRGEIEHCEEQDEDAWFSRQETFPPDTKGPYGGDLDMVRKHVSLHGSTVQCILKLANIVLTPENPKYPGGSWHVEGEGVFM